MPLARANWHTFFATILIGLAASFSLAASARGASRAGDWVTGSAQGFSEYQTTSGSSYISIGCDIAATLDHSEHRNQHRDRREAPAAGFFTSFSLSKVNPFCQFHPANQAE